MDASPLMGSVNDLNVRKEMNNAVSQIYALAHHLLQKVNARDCKSNTCP